MKGRRLPNTFFTLIAFYSPARVALAPPPFFRFNFLFSSEQALPVLSFLKLPQLPGIFYFRTAT